MLLEKKTNLPVSLGLLRSYKKFISPLLSSFNLIFPVACKFYPTCSAYSGEAISQYGVAKGLILSLKRIFRCHPFSKGGIDLP